jgi:hypothetical protein
LALPGARSSPARRSSPKRRRSQRADRCPLAAQPRVRSVKCVLSVTAAEALAGPGWRGQRRAARP